MSHRPRGNHCASEATSFGWNIQAIHTGHLKEDNEENVVITRTKKKKSQNFWNVKMINYFQSQNSRHHYSLKHRSSM